MEWPFVSRQEYQRALAERNDADRCFRLAQAKLGAAKDQMRDIPGVDLQAKISVLRLWAEPEMDRRQAALEEGREK